MENRWLVALWPQVGAALDMLDNALIACPPERWEDMLWSEPDGYPSFWRLTFHTLKSLEINLAGSAEGYAPPPPLSVHPTRPYTKDELRTYLAFARNKCQTTYAHLSDEAAVRVINIPWLGMSLSYLELQLLNLRHLQEHVAQLSLFLGQHATDRDAMDAALDWIPRARDA